MNRIFSRCTCGHWFQRRVMEFNGSCSLTIRTEGSCQRLNTEQTHTPNSTAFRGKQDKNASSKGSAGSVAQLRIHGAREQA